MYKALNLLGRMRISTLCQAYGKVASHSLCSELKDAEVVAVNAETAFNVFGFRRMWSVHPDQIEPIFQASHPEQELIECAAQILAPALAEGWPPIRHEDRLHDRASYRYLWTVLKSAYLSAFELPACAMPLFTSVLDGEGRYVMHH